LPPMKMQTTEGRRAGSVSDRRAPVAHAPGSPGAFSKSMKPGERWSTWRAGLLLALLLGAGSGWATDRAHVPKNLMADQATTQRNEGVSEHYQAACPDVLEVKIPGRPELSRRYTVQVDGRIDLGDYGRLRVEGQPLQEIARLLAAETGSEPEQIEV